MATNKNIKKPFRRHFRIYFKNNHPAYIVDEEGNTYVFHRTTHSKTSGGKKNWSKQSPLKNSDSRIMYIVKKEQKDFKSKFSPFELEIIKGVDVSYPEIKKVGNCQTTSDTGSHQAKRNRSISRSRYESSTLIKPKKRKTDNRKYKKPRNRGK